MSTAPWTSADKDQWFKAQTIKRSYEREVVRKIEALSGQYVVESYGVLSIDPKKYPLFLVSSKNWDANKKTVLITGGVHGYETSGVHGALAFMKNEAHPYEEIFNFVCAPCVSPWAYETINRWNPHALDPNRNFVPGSPAEECVSLLRALEPYQSSILAHFDLHETTDTDNTVFRPALEARDAKPQPFSPIPDGFYTVGDSDHPLPEFEKAIIDSVRKVTHIAPADEQGCIIGEPIAQEGVIHYPLKRLSLCAGLSNAPFTTTTEVYPDSPRVNDQICIDAQVAAVRGGLDYLKSKGILSAGR